MPVMYRSPPPAQANNAPLWAVKTSQIVDFPPPTYQYLEISVTDCGFSTPLVQPLEIPSTVYIGRSVTNGLQGCRPFVLGARGDSCLLMSDDDSWGVLSSMGNSARALKSGLVQQPQDSSETRRSRRRRWGGMRRPSLLMALEPRVMFDGAAVVAGVDAVVDSTPQDTPDAQLSQGTSEDQATNTDTSTTATSEPSSTDTDPLTNEELLTTSPSVSAQEQTELDGQSTSVSDEPVGDAGVDDTTDASTMDLESESLASDVPLSEPVDADTSIIEYTSSDLSSAEGDLLSDAEQTLSDEDALLGESTTSTVDNDQLSDPTTQTTDTQDQNDSDDATTTESQIVEDDPALATYAPGETDVSQVIFIDSTVGDYEILVQGIIDNFSSTGENTDSELLDSNLTAIDSIEDPVASGQVELQNDSELSAPESTSGDNTNDDSNSLSLDFTDGLIVGNVQIFLLDGERDGIEQITEVLAGFQGLAGVHIVSHGTNGSVKAGNTWLRTDNLDTYANDIASWQQAFSDNGDLLFYGCDLASNAEGQQLVDSLSELTGADVAASTDDTGHESLGGDWQLEYQTGAIETTIPLNLDTQSSWENLLAVITVDTTADVVNGDTSSVANLIASDGGDGISLREAIIATNNTAGTDTIFFNIPDPLVSGAHTISVLSALPDITDTVIIDGTSEPDYAGSPMIELDGTSAGAGVDGLRLVVGSDGSTIQGLVIQNFDHNGILLQSGSNTIAGNYIGLDADGTTIAGNNISGIGIQGGIRIESADNIIGGLTVADRNVVSGNVFTGIAIVGPGATGNQVLGNYIGTDAGGTLARGNTQEGIEIDAANSNIIGGLTANARNVISGNGSDGIEIDSADFNVIQGNYIGTDFTGTLDLGNVRDGIDINENAGDGAIGNLIGGTDPNAGNLIFGNDMNGIEVRNTPTVDNAILGNSIYGNGLLGINLGLDNDGVTPNDLGDGDIGSNDLQNFPVLTVADTNGIGNITIDGSINSTPSTTLRIEFFTNTVATGEDPSMHGEGETYLGFTTVTTDVGGNASFSASLSAIVALGEFVTATATEDLGGGNYGSTSEFALNVVATSPADPPLINDATAPNLDENSVNGTSVYNSVDDANTGNDTDQDGDPITYTLTAGNTGNAFAINSATGEITVNDSTQLNFETTPSYNLEVTASDGTLSDTAIITINLNDLNESPTALNLSNSTVDEGIDTSSGYAIGALSSFDPDAGDSATYSIVGGADQASFSIGGAGSNELTLTDGVLDDAVQASYQVIVRVTDSGGLTVDQSFTVSVNNLGGTTVTPPSDDNDPGDTPSDDTTDAPPPEDTNDDGGDVPPALDPDDPTFSDDPTLLSEPLDVSDIEESNSEPLIRLTSDGQASADAIVDAGPAKAATALRELLDNIRHKVNGGEGLSADDRNLVARAVGYTLDFDEFRPAGLALPALDVSHALSVLLDAMKHQMTEGEGLFDYGNALVTAAVGLTLTLSVGYVTWFLRFGYLLASLLSFAPMLHTLDPLPILVKKHDEPEKPSEDQELDYTEDNDSRDSDDPKVDLLFESATARQAMLRPQSEFS